MAEAVDVHGEVVARSHADAPRTATDHAAGAWPPRSPAAARARCALAVVSVADPVDRETGRLVELPDAPFLVGELDAPAVLAELVDGPVTVDNDVNWMARAERGSDFVYVYLGEGVGCAVVSDGEVLRGHAGLAGRDRARGDGRARRAGDAADRGLRRARPPPPGLDRDRRAGAAARRRPSAGTAGDLASAVAGVLSAAVALADPAVVLLGGAVGPRSARARRGRARVRPVAAPRPGRSRRRGRRAGAGRGPSRPRCESCATRSSPPRPHPDQASRRSPPNGQGTLPGGRSASNP